ncbi:MAG: DNA-processing protein DprA [Puniceicoccales bacterium]|nr:DNA-processing protein DprA [Puniceicoccales bacterium]
MHTPPDVRAARLVLNALPNIGPVTCRRLDDALPGGPEAIFRASHKELISVKGVGEVMAETLLQWRKYFNLEREQEKMAARNLRFVIPEDGDAYPSLLREIYDPPLGLYSTSAYHSGSQCIAIVGTRRRTAYGEKMAHTLARELAASGWCVVSGLARGIDTAVHEGALEGGGVTVAVLGCGVDIVYPPENLDLYRKIAANGVVFSEFFLGRVADKQTFPMRNRIVSGMSRAVVVVESDEGGGSMITARFAGEQGRTVCAVPGRVDQISSRGCHALIRDGATLVTCVDDILSEIGAISSKPAQGELRLEEGPAAAVGRAVAATAASGVKPGSEEEKILNALSGGTALSMDALCDKTGMPIHSLSGTLLMMELNRLVSKMPDGSFEAV